MLALGFILFGTTQLLPQMVQDLFGYTATLAGWVITPGGLAVMVLMPVIGLLMHRIQPRVLIAIGLFIEAAALEHLTGIDTNVSYEHLMWARVYQAGGIAFLFVPITTVAYVGLTHGQEQ